MVVRKSDPVSRTPEVAIIGGGIIGCAAAAFLAERGASVTIFEQTAVGAGASGRNLGAIQHPFDPVLAELYPSSLDHYHRLADACDAFAVADAPAGLLLLNADAGAVRRQVEHFRQAAPELEPAFLSPEDVAEVEPALSGGFAACRLATGYPVPPDAATAAYATLALRRGAALRLGVSAAPWVEGDRARGVTLGDGSRVEADAVLVAAGPWTPAVVDPSGDWQPIHRTWGVTVQLRLPRPLRHVLEEDEVDSVNRPAVATARAAASTDPEPPSLFSIASAGDISTLGSTFLPIAPDPAPIAGLLRHRAQRFLPSIGDADVVQVRVCARPQSVDGRPFIGPVAGVDALFVCAGHGPWGISTGPASAELVVGTILGEARIPAELRADRAVQTAQALADTGPAGMAS